MDNAEEKELWSFYTSVWRNVLTNVLGCPKRRVNAYIRELKDLREEDRADPSAFGFFYDTPCRYLTRALLGDGMHKQIMDCNIPEANPIVILKKLVRAIANSPSERDMEDPSFDWDKARTRYQRERQAIEAWLAAQNRK